MANEKLFMKILQYGLQRSGTNFLEALLKKNYRIRILNDNKDRSSPLQKHFRLYDNKEIIPEPKYLNDIQVENFAQFERLFDITPDYYLIISKDPYSWFLSYNKWAQKCRWPDVNYHYIEEYNLFYGKFLEFSRQTNKIIFIRYIDLLRDAESVLNQLEVRMNLKKKLFAQFLFKKANKVSESSRFSNEKRAYYIEEQYLQKFNSEDLQTLNTFLDPLVVSLLGYEKKAGLK